MGRNCMACGHMLHRELSAGYCSHHLEGKRIKLLQMYDPDPIPVGSEGTVTFVNPTGMRFTQIGVKWDNGRTLMLSVPPDKYEVL